jgi:hypothetical protein
VESGFEVLGESIDKRGTQITDAFEDITGAAKESEDAIADVIIAAGEAGEAGGGTGDTTGKGREIELQEKVRKIKLAILKAEARGQEDAANSLKRRLELAEKILKIMQETGATQREATIIANSQTSGTGSTASTGGKPSKRTSGKPSRFGPEQTMEQRERAAGLFLAGGDPLSGRRGPEDMSAMRGTGREKAEEITNPIVKAQNEMTEEIKKLRTDPVN